MLVYDSLGRLSSACNPESGTTSYTYDSDSNLTTSTNALGKGFTLVYDALSRVTSKTYNDNGSTPVTPTVAYTYTGPNQTQDFPAMVSAGVSAYTYSGYDALGRPGAAQQTTGTAVYPFTGIAWTPQGSVKSITYPSGRTIATSFDSAGRPLNVSGTLSSSVTYYTSAGVQYAAHGGVSQLNTSDNVSRAIGYNSRLQVLSLAATTNSGSNTLLSLGYTYGASSSQNNGNLATEAITRPGFSVSQSYGYDGVNRLTSAGESSGWSQNYVFDSVGNRAVTANQYIPASSFLPQTSNTTVPCDTHNHWTGAGYDAAGNMTSLVSQTLTYDAESRMTALSDGSTVDDTFAYDGDG